MSKKRVLVLHSFKDKGYEARLQQIANNPSLDEISFRHCCLIDRNRPSARIPEIDRLADQGLGDQGIYNEYIQLVKEVVNEEVGPLLDEQIIEFNPEVVIIHSGTVFTAAPGACLIMVIELMKKHPGLPFALEGKSEWLIRQVGVYDNIPWDERLVRKNLIRWASHNFIDDDEVEEIIKAVF